MSFALPSRQFGLQLENIAYMFSYRANYTKIQTQGLTKVKWPSLLYTSWTTWLFFIFVASGGLTSLRIQQAMASSEATDICVPIFGCILSTPCVPLPSPLPLQDLFRFQKEFYPWPCLLYVVCRLLSAVHGMRPAVYCLLKLRLYWLCTSGLGPLTTFRLTQKSFTPPSPRGLLTVCGLRSAVCSFVCLTPDWLCTSGLDP